MTLVEVFAREENPPVLTYISTLTPPGALRVVVARAFDSFWTADACRADGERIFRLADVRYATREVRPGDSLRVGHDGGILPPHESDDAAGNPVPKAEVAR